jgi:hypothetical protein
VLPGRIEGRRAIKGMNLPMKMILPVRVLALALLGMLTAALPGDSTINSTHKFA